MQTFIRFAFFDVANFDTVITPVAKMWVEASQICSIGIAPSDECDTANSKVNFLSLLCCCKFVNKIHSRKRDCVRVFSVVICLNWAVFEWFVCFIIFGSHLGWFFCGIYRIRNSNRIESEKRIFFSLTLLSFWFVVFVWAAVCHVLAEAVVVMSIRRRKFYCTVLWPGFIGMLTLYICIATNYTLTIFNYTYTFALSMSVRLLYTHAHHSLPLAAHALTHQKLFDSCHMSKPTYWITNFYSCLSAVQHFAVPCYLCSYYHQSPGCSYIHSVRHTLTDSSAH